MSGFQDAGLQAVALEQAVRDVEAAFAAEHFDGSLEQDYGSGAVDVVVTIEKDGLVVGDCGFKAVNSSRHAEHEKRIVEVGCVGI
jgi:hypothetical protein